MSERPAEPAWVDYTTAEMFSSLSHTTLWRHVSSGRIKAARVGRSVRIHLPSLRAFMEERCADYHTEKATVVKDQGFRT